MPFGDLVSATAIHISDFHQWTAKTDRKPTWDPGVLSVLARHLGYAMIETDTMTGSTTLGRIVGITPTRGFGGYDVTVESTYYQGGEHVPQRTAYPSFKIGTIIDLGGRAKWEALKELGYGFTAAAAAARHLLDSKGVAYYGKWSGRIAPNGDWHMEFTTQDRTITDHGRMVEWGTRGDLTWGHVTDDGKLREAHLKITPAMVGR